MSGDGSNGSMFFRAGRLFRRLFLMNGKGLRYSVLLLALLGMGIVPQFFGGRRQLLGVRVVDFGVCAILVGAILAVGKNKPVFIIALLLGIPMLVVMTLTNVVGGKGLNVANHILSVLLFGFTACVILFDVLSAGEVRGNKIVGAICVYLFVGIIWSFLYSLVELLSPGSFQPPQQLSCAPQISVLSGMIYYSFVTLSTLGYGDIVPANAATRTLSWMEALTGPLYVAILIARLVGLHIAHSRRPE